METQNNIMDWQDNVSEINPQTYPVSSFKLTTKFCTQIDKLMRNFQWGKDSDKGRYYAPQVGKKNVPTKRKWLTWIQENARFQYNNVVKNDLELNY